MSKEIVERGAQSLIVHVFVQDSTSSTGAGKTGLAFDSVGLQINVIRPGEASPTSYTQAGGTIETIATIGTYSAPTATKCRFKEIDSSLLPGWYELQFADALFNTTNSRRSLGGMVFGASGIVPTPFQIQLSDPVRGVGSPTALPNAAAEAPGGLYTRGSGAGQIDQSVVGMIDINVKAINDEQGAASNLAYSCLALVTAQVATADGDPNTDTIFDTTLPLATADYYGNGDGGLVISFVDSFTNQFQSRRIVASVTAGPNTRITLEAALNDVPADSEVFVALGRITELS